MKGRIAYLDNLKLLVIVLVVIFHSSVTYSGIGSWYYTEKPRLDILTLGVFGFFASFSQAFAMGLLFFIAGYVIPRAYGSRGFAAFVGNRLFRLGMPTLLFMLAIYPLVVHGLLGLARPNKYPDAISFYANHLVSLDFAWAAGPLWFAEVLLLLSIVYALARLWKLDIPLLRRKAMPGIGSIFLLMGIIALLTFAIRIFYPIGTVVFNFQVYFFAQYAILFFAGIVASGKGWLERLDERQGKRWLIAAVVAGGVSWIALVSASGIVGGSWALLGGLHWQSAAYALWESFVGVAMAIGLLAVFRERCDHQKGALKGMAQNSFAVYVFHAPVVVSIALLLRPLMLHPLAKWAILSAIAVPVCFLFAAVVVRKIPVLNRMM